MSSPPPGYNPEASQLHGGTDAPIAKVMGGGGGAPDGYNETQSLLQGGTDAPIVKMTGGGPEEDIVRLEAEIKKEEGKNPKSDEAIKILRAQLQAIKKTLSRKPVRFGSKITLRTINPNSSITNTEENTAVTNGHGTPLERKKPLEEPKPVTNTIQVEVYKPNFSEEDSTEMSTFINTFSIKNTGVKAELNRLINTFRDRSKEKLKRYDKNSREQSALIPTVDINQTVAHKIVEVLPPTTSNIIIVPPIRGNYETFIRSVEFLYATNRIDENDKVQDAVLIFMAPFFTKDGDNGNPQRLLYSFLTLQEKNPDTVFVLQNNKDQDAIAIGTALYTNILHNGAPLLNYLNPSYLLFPKKLGKYDGLLFSSADDDLGATFPKITNGFRQLSSLLLDKKKAFSFNASGTGAQVDETLKNYLTILSKNDVKDLPVTRGDVQACGSLKTVFDLADPSPFQILEGEDIYILRLGTNRLPLLCTSLIDDADKFRGAESDPAFYDALTVDVYVGGQKWKFRDTRYNEFSTSLNKVASGAAVPYTRDPMKLILNWERGIFSNSEAAFLNHLNLSPLLLGMIFKPENWKKELAKFLNNLVTTNCFEDTDILMKGSCQDTRAFLNTVYNYLFMNDSVKDEELDVPPLNLPPLPHSQDISQISWPPELEEIDEHELKMPHLGSLDVISNDNSNTSIHTYYIDLIVIHKKSFQRSARRLRLDKEETDKILDAAADPSSPSLAAGEVDKDTIIGIESIFKEILEDLKDDHPDFLFIY